MVKINIVKLAAIALFISAGMILSYALVGVRFIAIFLIVCLDALIVLRIVRMGIETGIELATFATILVAAIYGPWMAFIFGLLLVPLIMGSLGLITWSFSPVHDVGWPPLIPSPDSLILGIIGFISGTVYSQFGLLIVAGIVAVISKSILQTGKELLLGNPPRVLAYTINAVLTMALLLSVYELFAI